MNGARRGRRRYVLLALVLLGAAAIVGWRATRGRNELGIRGIVLVTLDTVRTDRLGCYGGKGGLTPQLDRLAAGGVLFERCLTTVPITLPAHASILSGTDPIAHGARINGAFAFHPENPSLAVALHDKGFRTGAFVSDFVLERRFGLDLGFDEYDDRFAQLPAAREIGFSDQERRGMRTVDAALGFVERVRSAPFFLWVHLFDCHAPYQAPAPWSERHADPYDAELAYADHCVGELLAGLERLGRAEDVLVAVVGDHGEGLGDHGELTHTTFLYDTTLLVPFLLWSPGKLPEGRRIGGTTSITSVAPTLLDLLALEVPPGMYGPSRAAQVQSGAPPADGVARFETLATRFYYGFAPLHGIEADGKKLIVAPRPELYDVRADPGETANRHAERGELARNLEQRLAAYDAAHATGRTQSVDVDAEMRDHLAQLGYTGLGRPDGDGAELPDPKDGIHVINELQRAGLEGAADPAGSITRLEALLATSPGVAEAHEMLGDFRSRLVPPDVAGALEAYREAARLRPLDPLIHSKLGEALLRLARPDEARRAFEQAIDLDPTFLRARVLLAQLHQRREDLDLARQQYDRVLERAPELFEALKGRGYCLLRGDNWRLAELDLRAARDLRPDDVEVLVCLGQVYERLVDVEKALECYRAALALLPDGPLATDLRARVAGITGP